MVMPVEIFNMMMMMMMRGMIMMMRGMIMMMVMVMVMRVMIVMKANRVKCSLFQSWQSAAPASGRQPYLGLPSSLLSMSSSSFSSPSSLSSRNGNIYSMKITISNHHNHQVHGILTQ